MLTYLEPQIPEYHQFVETLKNDAKEMFNFTIKDSLVANTLMLLLIDVDLILVLLPRIYEISQMMLHNL